MYTMEITEIILYHYDYDLCVPYKTIETYRITKLYIIHRL